VSKAFKDYLDDFKKLFWDDVTILVIWILWICFEKCQEYRINLNSNKCAFMMFLRMIIGFIMSKKGAIRSK
jgi:hypothetical protein